MSHSKNLSGMNIFRFFQMVGSLPIAYTLINICAFFGTLMPNMFMVSSHLRGTNNGSGVCNRIVFFTIACKKGNLKIRDSSIVSSSQLQGEPKIKFTGTELKV